MRSMDEKYYCMTSQIEIEKKKSMNASQKAATHRVNRSKELQKMGVLERSNYFISQKNDWKII